MGNGGDGETRGARFLLLALGANLESRLGTPRATLEHALREIADAGVAVSARSGWYASPAFPPGSGPDFVNGAALLRSDLEPAGALALLHDVERRLGRVRQGRWTARVCDLDLLAAGDEVLPDARTWTRWANLSPERQRMESPDGLILPHPRLHERGFVLAPLAEIAPDWRHPVLGRTTREMLAALEPAALAGIEPLAGPGGTPRKRA